MKVSGQARLAAAGVSAREAEVLGAIGGRLTNREIAGHLVISVRTVESHVSSLLRKLGLPDRPALIRLARELAGGPVLPVPATSFVGRDSELAELGGLLTAGQLACITGPAGCGKTRLALEAARAWPGETRIAELGSVTAAEVSVVIAGALGLSYEAGDLACTARVALAGRGLLIIADNCEHVIAAVGPVLTALARAVPGLRILATSRQPLGVSEERVLTLLPLAGPAAADPADVADSAAGRLFADRARAASPQFRLDESSAPHVAAICRQLDGLPLAIELAAARVGTLDIATLAQSLHGRFRLLEQPARPSRHRSLSAAIDWSWQLLDDSERDLLGALAALPGEFTLPLAQAVVPGLPEAEVRSALARLVDQSLVSVLLTAGQPARYRLLSVIREFVAERAPAPAGQVRLAHARFCCDRAAAEVQAHYQLTPAAAPVPFDETNYLAALTWAARAEPDLADRLLARLAQLVEIQPTRRAIETLCAVAGAGAVPGGSERGWSSAALARASTAATYLNLDDAEHLARLAAARAAGGADRAYALWATGWVHAYRHGEAAALECLDQVIAYAREHGESWLEASAWQARGVARLRAGDAFDDWDRAVTQFVIAGDLMHANNVRYMLASRAVESGERLLDVPVWLTECESYATRRGYEHELAHIRRVRGVYERMQGHLEVARPLLDSALPVFRQAGDLRCAIRTLGEIARYHLRGDPGGSVDLLLQALAMSAIAADPAMEAQVLTSLVTAAGNAGDLPLAARALGALDALGQQSPAATAGDGGVPGASADLVRTLRGPAYATFAGEGKAGGAGLITTLYPRLR